MSLSNSAPKKTSGDTFISFLFILFRDLKRINNAIMVKIVVSEVDFRVLQTNDWTERATQLICITGVGLSSVEILAESVQ